MIYWQQKVSELEVSFMQHKFYCFFAFSGCSLSIIVVFKMAPCGPKKTRYVHCDIQIAVLSVTLVRSGVFRVADFRVVNLGSISGIPWTGGQCFVLS